MGYDDILRRHGVSRTGAAQQNGDHAANGGAATPSQNGHVHANGNGNGAPSVAGGLNGAMADLDLDRPNYSGTINNLQPRPLEDLSRPTSTVTRFIGYNLVRAPSAASREGDACLFHVLLSAHIV